jgi:drug/metabolite transporter (DMT)-like permease
MSLFVLLCVIAAALLHATWNALIKTGTDKLTSMMVMTLVQGGFGLGIAITRPLPELEVWPWLLASGIFHSAYKTFLGYAYEHGDLSRVYPIARGAAPMIVLGLSFFLLSDELSQFEYIGVVVLGFGILMMARGVFANAESARLVPFALGSAIATAGYSIVDGLGARVSGDAIAYVAWLFVWDAFFFTPVCLALRGRGVLNWEWRVWRTNGLAALASYGAYAIAVWAMTQAPIALVTALRETSILFAVLIGWFFFGDRMDRGKVIAVSLIICGVMLTRL